jgi:chromosome partitioning protein
MSTTADPDVQPRAVSSAILKGGVGKSTISINLARQLATRHDVLFVDLDPNGHATMGLGLDDAYERDVNLGNLVLDDRDAALDDVVVETDCEFDVLPSSETLEQVEKDLTGAIQGSNRLHEHVVEPVLGDRYQYVVIDQPAYPGMLNNNGLVATRNLVVPMTPGSEAIGGFRRTIDRLVSPLREYMNVNILAIVPNRLEDRIDQRTEDRKLLENLNSQASLAERLPNFARITAEEFARIDDREMSAPKPGIRERKAFTQALGENVPLLDYDPDNDQLEHLEELASIVERGVIRR